MRRAVLGAIFLSAGMLLGAGRTHRAESDDDSGSTLKVAGLTFVIPDRWESEPSEGPARAGQWHIPAPRGQSTEGVEVVVIFFGPGVGGSAQENIDAWAGTITTSDGRPAAAPPTTRQVAGHKVTQVLLSGNYAQSSGQPGLPPTMKPAYSLLGAVVENPAGNIYWRLTGPAAQVAAAAPALGKVLDSMKPLERP